MPDDGTSRLELLYQLGCAFAARIELDELIPLVVAKCRDVLHAEGASVLLLDEPADELYFPYVAGRDANVTEQLLHLRFPSTKGLAGEVLRTAKAIRVDDAAGDPRFFREIDDATGSTTRSIVAVPLAGRRGPIGVLEVVNRRDEGRFDDDDVAFLEVLAGSVAVAIENAQLYAERKAAEETLRAEVGALRRDLARRDRFTEIVASSAAMAEVFRLMESAAASPIAVLIQGETGTGKELVARGIHRAGERAAGPFIPVNCAALPESLLESELFGHKRGAFTGALQDRRGLFEAANGGTIFLDEVGEMPAVMQAKLLRVLQDGEIVPVGESRPRRVDVRVISATNRELSAEVGRGAFREDLYYRLAQFPITLPPLRERRDDVPLLADRFVAAAAKRHDKKIGGIASQAMALLVRFDWPGNVRQLQNEIERAVALATSGEAVAPRHLSRVVAGDAAALSAASGAQPPATPAPVLDVAAAATASNGSLPSPERQGAAAAMPVEGKRPSLREARENFEIAFIVEVLRQVSGNVTRAAQALGLSRVMLQRKMRDYGLR